VKFIKALSASVLVAGLVSGASTAALAFECKVKEASMAKPGG